MFRTLAYLELEAYSEPEAYSEHPQTSTMERFAKIAWKIKKVLVFLYISENGTF